MTASPSNFADKQPRPLTEEPLSKVAMARAQAAIRSYRAPAAQARNDHPDTAQAMPSVALAQGLRELRGQVVRTLFKIAETGQVMLLLRDAAGATFKLQGVPVVAMEEGRQIVAWASAETHPKYGSQYNAELIDEEVPLERRGAIDYMSRVLEGVGESMATRMYDAFGGSIYDVISNQTGRLLEVSGINESKARGIADSWSERSVVRSLWDFLAKHEGIAGGVPAKIYARFGRRSMAVVRQRPYEIARIDGVGFKIADKIALASGFPRDSAARISGAVGHILAQDRQQGHTSKPFSEMVAEVGIISELRTAGELENIQRVVLTLVGGGDLVLREIGGKQCLTPKGSVAAERAIACRLREISNASSPNRLLAAAALEEAESLGDVEQAQGVSNAFLSAISVITGRPGCGKTTVTKVLAKVAKDSGLLVVMCAPTGKAARRTAEATGFKSGTVHSLIGLRPDGRGGMTLEHDRSNPIKGDIFVLDESSMMDTATMGAFLNAIPDGARVVFVGDADQLPSVGPGNVLQDIMISGVVAVSRLKTIHRNALDSDIIVNAHRIINGDVAALDLKGVKDFQFKPAIEDADIVRVAVAQYREMVEKHGVDNVQVLAARRGTETGTHALNEALRMVTNPPASNKPFIEQMGQVLRLGDRVIRTSNNRELGVSNGEVGIITRVDVESKSVTVNFGDRFVAHPRNQLGNLELAFCITAHKSQGSEYAGVVLVTPRAHKFMLNRNLFYTAVTRGKKDVRVVGAPDAVKGAVFLPGSNRCTGLAYEIAAHFGATAPALKMPVAARVATPAAISVMSTISAARKSLIRRP